MMSRNTLSGMAWIGLLLVVGCGQDHVEDRAKKEAARMDCNTYAKALDEFAESHKAEFPETEGYPPVASEKALDYLWENHYLIRPPNDPWGKAYRPELKKLKGSEGVA